MFSIGQQQRIPDTCALLTIATHAQEHALSRLFTRRERRLPKTMADADDAPTGPLKTTFGDAYIWQFYKSKEHRNETVTDHLYRASRSERLLELIRTVRRNGHRVAPESFQGKCRTSQVSVSCHRYLADVLDLSVRQILDTTRYASEPSRCIDNIKHQTSKQTARLYYRSRPLLSLLPMTL